MGLLTRLITPRAATPENPRFSLNDPTAWDVFTDGGPSTSGVTVTRETALTYSPWWRGINLLSRDVAKVPILTYRRTGRKRSLFPKHSAANLLRWKPNAYQTAFIFWQQIVGHALSIGNGYGYVSRFGTAAPAEILPLDPECTWPVRDKGKVWYVHRIDGQDRKLPAEDVLHVKGYGFDGLQGYSVVQKAKDSLGLGMGAAKSQTVEFRNGMRPSIALETAGVLPPAKITEARESLEKMHSGLENRHRLMILNGLTAKPISFNASDAQLIETRQFEIREVANWIGVPPHKLGDNSRTAFASLEQENQSYLDESLDPWFCNIEQECRDKLLTEQEKADGLVEVEFHRKALERADTVARANANRAALGGRPWKTQNEAREEDGLDPLDDPKADEVLEPLNMAQPVPPGDPLSPGGPPADAPPTAPPPPKKAPAKKPPKKKE